jgi:hypothetical protein
VTEQLKLKEQFNTTLSEAISGVAVDDRIILDTGDGAAVSFLGDPEDAMFVALSMRDAVASQPPEPPLLRVRFGINLGPVRLIKDINGQPNIIGDGINVAQRIMTFAQPGQILVSRSYYDIIARLSEDYANLFHYEGARTDKHVREHEVYAVGAAPRRLRSRTLPPSRPPAASFADFRLGKLAAALAVDGKLLIVAPLAFVFIVGSAFAVRSYRKNDQVAAALVAAPAQRTSLPRSEAPRIAAVNEQRAAAPRADPPKASVQERRAPVQRREVAVVAPKESSVATSGGAPHNATLTLSVLPWGEVYIDGKKLGVSPPLRSVPVAPGKHQVEFRNASFPAHRQTLNVKPGESIIVSHRFR